MLVAATVPPCVPPWRAPNAIPDRTRRCPHGNGFAGSGVHGLNLTSAGSTTTTQTATSRSLLPSGYELAEGTLVLGQPLPLHFGGELSRVEIAYRLAGAAGAPVVVALGGISGGPQRVPGPGRRVGLVGGNRRPRAAARYRSLPSARHGLPGRQSPVHRADGRARNSRASAPTTRPSACWRCCSTWASTGCAAASELPTAAWSRSRCPRSTRIGSSTPW